MVRLGQKKGPAEAEPESTCVVIRTSQCDAKAGPARIRTWNGPVMSRRL